MGLRIQVYVQAGARTQVQMPYILACVQEWDILVGVQEQDILVSVQGRDILTGVQERDTLSCVQEPGYMAFVPAYEPPLEHTPVFLDPHDPLNQHGLLSIIYYDTVNLTIPPIWRVSRQDIPLLHTRQDIPLLHTRQRDVLIGQIGGIVRLTVS